MTAVSKVAGHGRHSWGMIQVGAGSIFCHYAQLTQALKEDYVQNYGSSHNGPVF